MLWSQITPSHSPALLDAAYCKAISSQSISRRLEWRAAAQGSVLIHHSLWSTALHPLTLSGVEAGSPHLSGQGKVADVPWGVDGGARDRLEPLCDGAEDGQPRCTESPRAGVDVARGPHSPPESCHPYTWCPPRSRAPQSRKSMNIFVTQVSGVWPLSPVYSKSETP